MTNFSLYRRAQDCLLNGVSNFQKAPERFIKGVYPTHASKGRGCWLWDTAGNKYLDFMAGGGTNILGYAHPQVTANLAELLNSGTSHSLAHEIELKFAEKVKELFPFFDQIALFHRIEPILAIPEPTSRHWRDESESNLRYPKFSKTGFDGIIPDLTILGGPIGAGFPLYVLGGKHGPMNDLDIDQDYCGDVLALSASLTTMTLLQTKYDLQWLWERGDAFVKEFNSVCSYRLKLVGQPTYGTFEGDPLAKALFWQEACKAGMLFGPKWYLTFPLAEEIPNAIGSIKSILKKISLGDVKLEGEMPA